jgi:alkylresorcinol/alkylpyrone synthase
MPRIIAAAHAVPGHTVQQDQVRRAITAIFQNRIENISEKIELFENSQIEQRHLVRPLDWYTESHTTTECNRIYIEEGTNLLKEAAANCLLKSGTNPEDVDHVISVSTTGMATPSMESRIFTQLGLRPETRRTPVWGLGCAAVRPGWR